jgi:hypothetical protein
MKTFTVTHDHLKLLQRMRVRWDGCEYGAPAIDSKRPYGNSNVEGDIAEILGWEYKEDPWDGIPDDVRAEAADIHSQMQTVLQILVVNLHIYPGTYERPDQYSSKWTYVGV